MEKVFDNKLLTLNLTDSYLRDYSHIKIGIKADYLFAPKEVSILSQIIKQAKTSNVPVLALGGCSNVLFGNTKDRVLILDKELPHNINFEDKNVKVSGNANINYLISLAANRDLGGLEFLSGIPAHISGLTKMNAGAFGSEISKFVKWIEIVNTKGEIKKLHSDQIKWNYRKTDISDYILSVCFRLSSIEKVKINQLCKKYISIRKIKQPLNYPNLGSIFKNPPFYSAGELIDKCDLKGTKKGDAEISSKHANIFINRGKATFSDMQYLIELARNEVYKNFKIDLELEIQVIN
ncbi:MAG: UDP-N-acetylmuramate dehydrogenase [Candidatus Cloacimonetes bacterium]|nr:UDP-N-acetylmuramate dehydrogenase [Candidatus Cloacimonadota bacterium]